ncbi:MAG: alginate lyase family protein [Lentisphaerae bacterium]|nr:alginate lyase family protein [Lentisphaerota bacterium]
MRSNSEKSERKRMAGIKPALLCYLQKRLAGIIPALLCYLLLAATSTLAAATMTNSIAFPARPRVAYTAAELAAWTNDPARKPALDALLARANSLAATNLYVPPEGGQWDFYYACPKDGATLSAESLARHVCPRCRAVFTDERTVAAYRTLLHNRLNDQCHDLALAYALTGDVKYAETVRQALLELARLYPSWERHDRWGRKGLLAVVGGKRYCHHLSEAVGIIKMAKAYDMIVEAPCFSPEDRAAIEKDFLRATVEETRRFEYFEGGRNNHQTWFNASYAVVGLALGDEALLRYANDGPYGLAWQTDHSVTEDGLWYEGGMAYHFYALDAIVEILKSFDRAGWPVREPRIENLFAGPLQFAYPDGRFPVINDSDPSSLYAYTRFYEWAGVFFTNPLFAAAARMKPDAPLVQGNSQAMRDAGLVFLRRGQGSNAVCAVVDYGQHGEAHGHPDKLNLMLFALGRELALDPGRISYSVPEFKTWARTTLAHNTVVIGQKDQAPTTGCLDYFEDAPDYAACRVSTDDAYPGHTLKRFLVLTDRFLVDVFSVAGKKKAALDWIVHARGAPEANPLLLPCSDTLGDTNGYQHLKALTTGKGQACFTFELGQPNGSTLRLFCLGDEASTLYSGSGIGYQLSDNVPFLLRRRTDKSAVFITLFDLSGQATLITNATAKLTDNAGLTKVDLLIETAQGPVTVTLNLSDPKKPDATYKPVRFNP